MRRASACGQRRWRPRGELDRPAAGRGRPFTTAACRAGARSAAVAGRASAATGHPCAAAFVRPIRGDHHFTSARSAHPRSGAVPPYPPALALQTPQAPPAHALPPCWPRTSEAWDCPWSADGGARSRQGTYRVRRSWALSRVHGGASPAANIAWVRRACTVHRLEGDHLAAPAASGEVVVEPPRRPPTSPSAACRTASPGWWRLLRARSRSRARRAPRSIGLTALFADCSPTRAPGREPGYHPLRVRPVAERRPGRRTPQGAAAARFDGGLTRAGQNQSADGAGAGKQTDWVPVRLGEAASGLTFENVAPHATVVLCWKGDGFSPWPRNAHKSADGRGCGAGFVPFGGGVTLRRRRRVRGPCRPADCPEPVGSPARFDAT